MCVIYNSYSVSPSKCFILFTAAFLFYPELSKAVVIAEMGNDRVPENLKIKEDNLRALFAGPDSIRGYICDSHVWCSLTGDSHVWCSLTGDCIS